jgi:hypothetical protein
MKSASAFLLACAALAAGCAQTQADDVSVVLAHGNCQQVERGAKVIDYAALARIRGAQLIDMEEGSSAPADALTLVAVSLGTRPSLGFNLRPAGAPTRVGETLTIRIAEDKPPTDAVVAQVITQPCLVFGVRPQGTRTLRFEDAAGSVVGAVELAPLSP